MAEVQRTRTQRQGYQIELEKPNDRDITDRNRSSRLANVLITSAIIVLFPVMSFRYLGEVFGFGTTGSFIGIAVGFYLLSYVAPRMFVYNPEWSGYVTQDAILGTMVGYGPGFHFAHWHEQRNVSGNYSLKVITRPFVETVPTKTSQVTPKVKYSYAISLPEITRTVGVDETTIEGGLTAFVGSFLTQEFAKYTAEEVRTKVGILNEQLSTEFMGLKPQEGAPTQVKDKTPDLFEKEYGFKTVNVVIEAIILPPAAQKTRDAIDEAENLLGIMAKLRGATSQDLAQQIKDNKISSGDYQNLLNRAMAISENATMDIKVIEGNIPAAVANLLAGQSGKGGRS
jgi:hypothetical protein